MKASYYWQFVRLKATGQCLRETLAEAKEFFLQQFPQGNQEEDTTELSDGQIQRQLWQIWQRGERSAEICLRCFISNQIEQTCHHIANQFGGEHGFKSYDLLPFVLNDFISTRSSDRPAFISLATEILASYDPERSNLTTWTNLKVKQNRELNTFLLEHGVYLVSDWAILNDTSPKQLERIYTEIYQIAQYPTQQAKQLLESYHAVYRVERLQLRAKGLKGQCAPPTGEQLQRMAEFLATNFSEHLAPNGILYKLLDMASKLRQYRIQARGGKFSHISLDASQAIMDRESLANSNTDDDSNSLAFLEVYRQQFEKSLKNAIAKTVKMRYDKLKQRSPAQGLNFLTGLSLFHCHGQTMGEIASVVGLDAQYQVTRLLKLKELRADIRREILAQLRYEVEGIVKFYTDISHLSDLDQKLDVILQELIEVEIQQAEAESIKTKGDPLRSRFALKLCEYLKEIHQC